MRDLSRRGVIGLVRGTATWPLAVRAQQGAKPPTIGFLGSSTATSQGTWVAAFTKRLRELGWIEGRTVIVEYRWAEGRPDRFVKIAAEFVQLKVDVIYAVGTEATLAAKQATAVIPIVFPIPLNERGIRRRSSLDGACSIMVSLTSSAATCCAHA